MTGTRLLAAAVCVAAAASAADAAGVGGLFNRKSRADAPKVKQLLDTLKGDPDEKRRLAAVAELLDFDPRTHSDVLPALARALRQDKAAVVRYASAGVLGLVKPPTNEAGVALELALDAEPDGNVREAIRNALWEYHVNGYRSPRGVEKLVTAQTAEPPLAARDPLRLTSATALPAATVTASRRPVATVVASVRPTELPEVVARPPVGWGGLPALPPSAAAEPPLAKDLPVGLNLPRPTALVVVKTIVTHKPPPVLNLTSEPPLFRPTPPRSSFAKWKRPVLTPAGDRGGLLGLVPPGVRDAAAAPPPQQPAGDRPAWLPALLDGLPPVAPPPTAVVRGS